MVLCATGWSVRLCRTGAAKRASSLASSSLSSGSKQASLTMRGSALYTPATSLQMVTRETSASAPITVAE
ncbi:Uncharacterised protein [Vibrio cholerae]|nr:Uncharacterised protein [Vibrio cholerae]CSD42525.1 Uncharacterised protein [Vibrio cholerae]CSD80600.1 Uncharacterised protein [Vibrio cholerae]CSI27624.1 Uncharacterised protein [Vibrio cholerae]